MKLENILSPMNLRHLSLVRFLIKNGSTHQNIIIKNLGYSKTTLIRDINLLNEIINPVHIYIKDTIELSVPKHLNNRYIFSCLLTTSSEFNLIEEIFFNENHSYHTLAQKLFMSESSVRRIIKKTNIVLEKFDVYIDSFPIKLVGNEQNICNLMIRIFEEKYTDHIFPFDKNQQYALQELLLKNLKRNSLNLNYPDIERIKLIVLVILKRIQNGHFQKLPDSELPDMYRNVINNPIYKKIFKSIFRIELSEKNVSYLFSPFFRTHFSVNIEHLKQLRNEFPSVDLRFRGFKKLINNIANHYSIEIDEEDSLIFHVYNTNELSLSFSHILYNKSKEFIDNLTLYNKEFSSYVKTELAKLNKHHVIDNYDVYALSYVLVSHWKNLAFQLQKNQNKIKVLLFFDSDVEHMEFIKELLFDRFNHKLDISIEHILIFKELKKVVKNFDLIITNIPDLDIEHPEVLCISMYPNFADFYAIEQFHQSIQQRNKRNNF